MSLAVCVHMGDFLCYGAGIATPIQVDFTSVSLLLLVHIGELF